MWLDRLAEGRAGIKCSQQGPNMVQGRLVQAGPWQVTCDGLHED